MSYVFAMYGVSLSFFNTVAGSKEQTIVDKALLYLEETEIPYFDQDKIQEGIASYKEHLHRIVYDGIVGGRVFPWEMLSEIFDGRKYADEFNIQGYITDVLVALFAQAPDFEDYSNYMYPYRNFPDLTSYNEADVYFGTLVSYFLKGRALPTGETGEILYYAYLTNAELNYFVNKLKTIAQTENIEIEVLEVLEMIRTKQLDLFVYAA